jgi:hypothetical protein
MPCLGIVPRTLAMAAPMAWMVIFTVQDDTERDQGDAEYLFVVDGPRNIGSQILEK